MATDLNMEAATLPAGTASLDDADATEYRGVSVLMADLVASTDRMEELGAEGYAELLRRFHTACNDAVRTRGGTVAQYQGDGIICYFGFPKAREDDAVRAVEAGLDIVEALKRTVGDARIETRLGISSGTVMLRSDGDQFGASAVGAAINRAARLEALADSNTVLVCEDTQRLVGASFQMRDLGEQSLKGFKRKQRVFSVLRTRGGVTTRFEALRGHQTADLIGRDTELARLRDCFAHTRESKTGAAIVVAADPGLGKSRLVSAFLEDSTTDGAPCFLLQCSPEHVGTPLHPVTRYLEWVAGTGAQDDDAARHSKIKRLITKAWGADDAETDTLLDLLSPLGAESEQDMSESVPLRRGRALTLLADKIFASVAGRGTFVIVFEDVHWIDPTSAALMDILIARIKEQPAVLVMTTRLEPPFGDGADGADLIRLAPLTRDDSVLLARQTLGTAGVDHAQINRIIEKSEGVPLFVQEYADMLGNASRHGDDRDVPLTLGGLVQSKLDRLERPVRRFAQAAAALGREFDPQLVAQIQGDDHSDVTAFCAALVGQKLVEPLPSANDGAMMFHHALVRDAIYNGMAGDRRRKVHEVIAKTYLNMGDRIPVEDHVLADHLARAGRHGEAVQRFLSAGMAAAGQGAAGEALAHLEAGLACIDALPESEKRDRLELQLCAVRGPTQMVTRGPGNPDFGATQARAMELVERLGLHGAMVPVIYNTALHAWATADLRRALNIAEAIELIDAADPSDGAYMAANTMRGLISWHMGDNATAVQALSRTIARHKPEVHSDLYAVFLKEFGVFSLFYLGLTHTVMGDHEAGQRNADNAAKLGVQMGFPHGRGFGLLAQFNTAMLRGDVDTADEASAEALEFSTRQGFPEFMAMSGFVQGWCATQRGALSDGVARMEDGLGFWSATGFTCWQALFAAILAPLMVEADRLNDADALVTRYMELIDNTGENQTRAPLLIAQAKVLQAQGHVAQAHASLSEARRLASQQGAQLWLDWADQIAAS